MKTHLLRTALTLFLAFPAPAWAAGPLCACAEEPFEDRLAEADAIFTGTVLSVTPTRAFGQRTPAAAGYKPGGEADPPVVVDLKIDEAFKGIYADQTTFHLHTSLAHYTCAGYPFEKGGKYLIFAYERQLARPSKLSLYQFKAGTYDVGGLCGGTKPAKTAAAEIEALRPLKRDKARSFMDRLLK